MINSSETDSEVRHRGRPRKHAQMFRFGPYVYNTPLGFQYSQPLPYVYPYQKVTKKNYSGGESPVLIRREKRSAAVKAMTTKKRKTSSSNESSSSSVLSECGESTHEEDIYEKLLDYNEEKDEYFVKLRNKSYCHCTWVSGDEIRATRVGVMKAKRYKHVGLNPDYVKVERVLNESYENGKKYVLIKWRGLPYEQVTFEEWDDAVKCEGFEIEVANYRERKRMRHIRMGIEWRPGRESHLRYDVSPVYRNGNTLRPYQLEGLNWLLNRWYFKQSCIMADEMGLGKTVQSVAFVNALFCDFDYGYPVLVVAPLSTLVHWEREFKNWTNLRVVVYHGSVQGREIINQYEFTVKTGNIMVRLFDVVITTYEMAMNAGDHMLQFEFGVGIFDEAHRLKNHNSKAAACLRAFSIEHKVLLSGTPIQNNLNELWALFNFIDRTRFNNLSAFLDEYKMENTDDVQKLQAVLKPLMLRRMKEDVETSIPMKEETIIEVELTMIQKRYYRAILEKNLEFLTKGDRGNAPNLINAMMELRKCCIHPYLLNGAESKIIGDYIRRVGGNAVIPAANFIENNNLKESNVKDKVKIYNKENGEEELKDKEAEKLEEDDGKEKNIGIDANTNMTKNIDNTLDSNNYVRIGDFYFASIDEYYKILIQSSGKLVLLDKLLQKLQGEHKVLIFSQMTRCLDLLSEYLQYRNYKYERIDGGVRGDLRQAAIDRFTNGEAFVFLLCTRAGGVGINLTAADTVVIFDSDWNPQNDLQAQARCHRIGQKNEVKIYRLVTKNSYEREMFDKAGMKLGLDRAILQKMSFDQRDTPVQKEDAIQLLLRKGAYGVLMETDDASQRFCEEDIDQILSRRTKVIRHTDGGNAFSKATFQVEEEIDDPDFWENLLKQRKFEENEGRIKRQCRRLAREGILTAEHKSEIAEMYKVLTAQESSDQQLVSEDINDLTATNIKDNIDDNKSIDNKSSKDLNATDLGNNIHDNKSTDNKLSSNINENKLIDSKIDVATMEIKLFKIFVTTLHKSPFATGIDIFTTDTNDPKFRMMGFVVKYCLDLIQNSKLKSDFSVYLERFLIDYDPNLFLRFAEFYLRYHEQFLFRIQVPCIIHTLRDIDDCCIEKARGFSHEDDKTIISRVLTEGYGTFTIRDKSPEEVSQRVRKIISVLYHQKEIRENDNLYFKTLLTFGRPTDKNELAIEKSFAKDTAKLYEIVDRICKMTKRARRDTTEGGVYDRIVFFDKLEALTEIPVVRRAGMPPRWDTKKDAELRDHLLKNGLLNIQEKFKISEDMAIKRFELIFKNINKE